MSIHRVSADRTTSDKTDHSYRLIESWRAGGRQIALAQARG